MTALKLEVESLEKVDEAHQALYTAPKEEGGVYTLNVEGLPDVKGLKTALDKERGSVKTLKADLKKFDGVDLEKYSDLANREVELMKHDPEAVEKMISDRVKKNDDTWKTKYSDLEATVAEKDSRLSNLLVTDELRKIGGELGVEEGEPMLDFISRGANVFRFVDDKVVPMKDGEPVYGESGVEHLTMREFGKKLSETATHLFKSSGGGGANNGGDNGARGGNVSTKADLKTPADKARFIGKHGREAYLRLPDAKAG